MIFLDKVTKLYRTKEEKKFILRDCSYAFLSHQNIGILGINGAGKSTLIRMIAGIEAPNAGHIYRNTRVSFPLGFSGTFVSSLSGRENATFLARAYGVPVRQVIDFAGDFAELGSYFDMPLRSYSSGMRARLAFGISMAIDFDVYLIDEVAVVGDARFQKRCHNVLQERFQKANVIVVSHSPYIIEQYCTCAAILDRGALTFYDNLQEAIAFYQNSL